ncbi:MAG: trigger factor [Coriobacteriaceae bacterium]|nr:trigger factor [Coriobacteriaceae bacterium]
MEVTKTVREDGKTQVTAAFTSEEVKPYIDATFKKLGKARIPGFRPGRAPRPMIEQAYGGHEAVYTDITKDFIEEKAPLAVDSEDIIFIDEPEYTEHGLVEDGESFTFSLFADVKPEVTLSSTDPVEIELPSTEVTEQEVDDEMAAMQEYYFSFETVTDRAVEPDDYIQFDLACTDQDGKQVAGLNSSNRLMQLGQGVLPPNFDEQIIGMVPGKTKEFDFTADGSKEFEFLGDGPIHATATVNEIRVKNLPELNDEFAKTAGMESIEDMREKMRETVEYQKSAGLPDLKERLCVEQLADRVTDDVSPAYVSFVRQQLTRDFFNRLQQDNMTFDQFLEENGVTTEDFMADLEKESQENAVQMLALDALFRDLDMELTEADIDKEFESVDNPEEVRAEWEKSGGMSLIREGCRRIKATSWLVDNAIVTETKPEDADKKDETKKSSSSKQSSAKKSSSNSKGDTAKKSSSSAKKSTADKQTASKKPATKKSTTSTKKSTASKDTTTKKSTAKKPAAKKPAAQQKKSDKA